MADDIDNLLDEVEEKYLSNDFTINQNGVQTTQKENDELSVMIKDIYSAEDSMLPRRISAQTLSSMSSRSENGDKRCLIVYLGGCDVPTGCSQGTNKRACSNLRCLNCDFKVAYFEDFTWKRTTDYLFLRNNMPVFERIKENLLPLNGNRAYACQCNWRSIRRLTDIQSDMELKWTCGRH